MSQTRSALLLFCCLFAQAAEQGTVIDRPVRYVNDAVVTIGDVHERMAIKADEYRRRGLVQPETAAELDRFARECLEELTDDELLIQKAKELKVQVPYERLTREVREEARRRGLPLRMLSTLRKIRERQFLTGMIADWFEGRHEQVSPEQIRAAFLADAARWSRPARAQTLQLAIAIADERDRVEARTRHAALFRAAAAAADARITAASARRLDAFADGSPAAQDTLIDELAAELAALDPPPAAPADRQLVADAAAIITTRRFLRPAAETLAELGASAARINALPITERQAALQAEARRLGLPALGEPAWSEAGANRPEVEREIFSADIGKVDGPVAAGASALLILVLAREDARVRTLPEATAELTEDLDRARRDQIRLNTALILRSRATVRDVE